MAVFHLSITFTKFIDENKRKNSTDRRYNG
jgi:hypothetical protein